MIKKILLLLIDIYQNIFSSLLRSLLGISRSCRYETTCSEYSKKSIQKYGVAAGLYLSIKRVLSCQPFYNSKEGYLA